MRLHYFVIVSSAMIAFSTSRAICQSADTIGVSVDGQLTGSFSGWSIGIPGVGRETFPELFTLGLHWTDAEAYRLGLDFSLGTAPRAFFEGAAVLGLRGGVALPMTLGSRVVVLPSGGVSVIAAAGSGFLGAISGFNTGLAVVVLNRSRGLRTGVTWHWLEEGSEPLWLWEFGFVSLTRP